MKLKWSCCIIVMLLIIFSPFLFRKYHVPLISNGAIIATGIRPSLWPNDDKKFTVYVGDKKVFSMWTDLYDFPMFVYPFADGNRFLCDYDDDVDTLVFVVDSDISDTNLSNNTPKWPANDQLRELLARRATNVVIETKGLVRLPTYAELQEVSSCISSLSQSQINIRSSPTADFGIYRFYASKESLLLDLATNRQSVW